ncbi:F-box only protein 48 [Paroedura picta]|uniref:F-box only protein 48 n=1 Tax=Paroedura picta TaxID=143630 RepID=UPI0010143960
MLKGSKETIPRHNKPPVVACKKFSVQARQKQKASPKDFVQLLPLEICLRIFSQLDIQSLCNAAMTCRSWNCTLESCDHLWKRHCLTIRVVCQREIDRDRDDRYSWKVTLLRNYWKSKVKQEWLSGTYSNVRSHSSLPEKSMYPMDMDTWGEILEAELER